MRKLSLVIGLFLTLSLLSGCGGGGGGSSSSSGASVSGYVLVPTDTPTDSARLNLRHFVKAFLNRELFAASTTKPVPEASIVLAKLDTEGKLNTVNTTVAMTDAQGKYTLSGIPEGNNWVLFAKKVVKDTSGNKKDLEVKHLVTIQKEDIGKTKEGEDLTLEGTIAVETVKDIILDKNSGKPDNQKIEAADLESKKIEEIKQIYASHEADIYENANPVDILTKDPTETEAAYHQRVTESIESLKQAISTLKVEIDGKINEILSSGTVTGFVTDASGTPLPSATVALTGGDLSTSKTTTLFTNGQYILHVPVSSNAYTLTVSLQGYATKTFSIYVTQLMTVQQDVTLPAVSSPTITSLTTSQTQVTAGGSLTLQAQASDPDGDTLTYSWSATGGTLTGKGSSVIYTAPSTEGTYTVTVKVSDGTSEATQTVTLTVIAQDTTNQPPSIDSLSSNTTTGQAPLAVSFTASASDSDGSIASFSWDFGDGTTSNTQNPTHTFTLPGGYTVTLTVTDDKGSAVTQTLAVTVQNTPPTVSLSASPTSGFAPLTVSFSANFSDADGSITKILWDYDGDGTADFTSASPSGTALTTSFTYSSAGTYTATFSATDDQGDTTSQSLTFTIKAPNQSPTVSASAAPTTGTAPLTVQFTGSCSDPDGTCAIFSWDFGDGSAPASTQSPSYTYTQAGSYTVTFSATDDAGATSSFTLVITVSNPPANQPPTASLSSDVSSGTAPLTVSFTLSYTDPEGKAGTYSLDFGDTSPTSTGSINSGASTTLSHTYQSAGTYTAQLTVTDDQGATDTASVSITVSAPSGQLVAYWKFDEGSGTQALDASGNGNTLTLFNGVSWVQGIAGTAADFDGIDDFGEVKLSQELTFSTGDSFTIHFWFKAPTVTSSGRLGLVTNYRTVTTPHWAVVLGGLGDPTPGEIAYNSRDTSGSRGDAESNEKRYDDNTWHHVVAVRNTASGEVRLYIDGALIAAGTDSTSDINSGQSIWIGNHLEGFFKFAIDEIKIYNYARTAAEIQQDYQAMQGNVNVQWRR